MTESGIVIRDITEAGEMRAVEELQKEVWGMSDRDIVSVFMMAATGAVGGVLVGAFDGPTLVGFAYGFVGLYGGRPIMHSDMLAVRPGLRGRGVGFRLKLAQRERALRRGLRLMTWTFDPLQAANARLNFGKLGVVSADYCVNFYGEHSSSPLHATGTDRLWLAWPLDSRRVLARINGEHASPPPGEGLPVIVRAGADGAPAVGAESEAARSEQLLIEIPRNFGELQTHDPALAFEWRLATRDAFTSALAAGFLVEEFYAAREGRRGGAYLLTRGRRVEDFTS